MKVAVYSGSFNPMHIGHIAVVEYLLGPGAFDMVYIIVSPHNPFKDGSISDNSRERYEAANQAIERHGLAASVKVDDLEFHRPTPSYTIDTLDILAQREPQNSFTLVIGGDNIGRMLEWKEGERLLCEYGIAVYPRGGFDSEAEVLALRALQTPQDAARLPFRIQILQDAPLVTVSSTQIRQMIARSEDVSKLLA